MAEIRVFISSKMIELKQEREVLAELLPTLLKGVARLHPWPYEREVTTGGHARDVYLPELRKAALYIALLGSEYSKGTIEEFEEANEWRIDRQIYVKKTDSKDEQLDSFIRQNNDLAMVYFDSIEQLRKEVKRSVEKWVTARLTKESERRRRSDLLIDVRKRLRQARSDYADYLRDYPPGHPQNIPLHTTIINRAIEACEEAYDKGNVECRKCLDILAGQPGFEECSHKCEKYLAYIAKLRLTINQVVGIEGDQQRAEEARWRWWGNRNKDALKDALDRIGELIEELE